MSRNRRFILSSLLALGVGCVPAADEQDAEARGDEEAGATPDVASAPDMRAPADAADALDAPTTDAARDAASADLDPDAGCVAGPEICNEVDDDCDEEVDEGLDGRPCEEGDCPAGAVWLCEAGHEVLSLALPEGDRCVAEVTEAIDIFDTPAWPEVVWTGVSYEFDLHAFRMTCRWVLDPLRVGGCEELWFTAGYTHLLGTVLQFRVDRAGPEPVLEVAEMRGGNRVIARFEGVDALPYRVVNYDDTAFEALAPPQSKDA